MGRCGIERGVGIVGLSLRDWDTTCYAAHTFTCIVITEPLPTPLPAHSLSRFLSASLEITDRCSRTAKRTFQSKLRRQDSHIVLAFLRLTLLQSFTVEANTRRVIKRRQNKHPTDVTLHQLLGSHVFQEPLNGGKLLGTDTLLLAYKNSKRIETKNPNITLIRKNGFNSCFNLVM